MAFKTKNEKAADELLKALELIKPNCYMCRFFQPVTEGPFPKGKCMSPVGRSIMMDEDGVRKSIGAGENAPLFPVTTVWIEEDTIRSEVEIPSIIATEFGTMWGLVKWPSLFDPIYIVFCLFFEELNKKIDD